ncbi:MAG: hypothetical protein HPY66_3640 [Firmicutes bacterium]|nr:hypothetical protein [Bacillota bacterium]
MSIVRVHKKENPYVIIDKTGVSDTRLSWKARGLLCYLLSKPDDWKVNVKHLANQGPDGERATRSGLKELERYGYMVTRPVRDDKGRITEWEHNIFEIPQDVPGEDNAGACPENGSSPDCQNVDLDEPDVQNVDVDYPHLDNAAVLNNEYIVNKELLNNDCTDISVYVSQSVSRSCRSYKEGEIEKGSGNDGPTGGRMEKEEIKDFNRILENCHPEYFDTPEAIRGALEDMYFGRGFAERCGVPRDIVRGRMRRLNHDIVGYAVSKMERAAADGADIRNSVRYLQACIYNAVTEYEGDIIADEMLARLKRMKTSPAGAEDG